MHEVLYCIIPRDNRIKVGLPMMVVPMDRQALAARYGLPPDSSMSEMGKRAEAEGYQIMTQIVLLKKAPEVG